LTHLFLIYKFSLWHFEYLRDNSLVTKDQIYSAQLYSQSSRLTRFFLEHFFFVLTLNNLYLITATQERPRSFNRWRINSNFQAKTSIRYPLSAAMKTTSHTTKWSSKWSTWEEKNL
jgi:hypothetical protein